MHETVREHRALGQLSAQARGGGMHPVPHMERRYIRGAKDVEAASLNHSGAPAPEIGF